MRNRVIAGALMVAAFAAGLSLNVDTYWDQNGGVVVSVKEVPVCLGLEVKGVPGFFGGIYDGCDF